MRKKTKKILYEKFSYTRTNCTGSNTDVDTNSQWRL